MLYKAQKQAACRHVGMLASGHWLKKQQATHSNLCWQRLLCGSITLLVLLLFKPVATGQHPYMQLVWIPDPQSGPGTSSATRLYSSQEFSV